MLLGKGGFVVETGDAPDKVNQLGMVSGVSAIGVGTDGVGWSGQTIVGNYGAVGKCPVHASLDVVDL